MERAWFENKVALVTGSSRGIGRAVALRFAELGVRVTVNHRSPAQAAAEKARRVCAEIEGSGSQALLVRAEISRKASVAELVRETERRFGRLDFLILNAARAPFKPLERLLERDLRQLVETNFMGHIFCVQEALPLLEKSGGRIVFVSSLGSRFASPSYPLGSMKAAMEAVVRDLSESLRGRGVNVNGVCGGLVKTDSFKVFRLHVQGARRIPEELFVEPQELADVIVFLCGPGSAGIRGQTVVVDRGLSNSLYRTLGE